MTHRPQAELSLKAIASGLRKTTEVLAHELAAPGCTTPVWSDHEWRLARATAAIHGVSPLLSVRLRWRGPEPWAQFLAEQKVQTTARHRRILELLAAVAERARAQGICAIGLKGAALHAMGLYAVGERPMADIDLLVHQPDLERTSRVLESFGFRQTYATWKDRTFEPAERSTLRRLGEDSANYIKFELHDRAGDVLALRPVDISACVFTPGATAGVNGYPSTASLMLHLLLHAAGAMACRSLRLLNLHDIALLGTRLTSGDWDHCMRLGTDSGGVWWAYPPAALTVRYYPQAIPPSIIASVAADCPRPLRRAAATQTLSDVSLSYPWISAFPSIRWTRSLREAAEYAWQRIVPSAERITARKLFVSTQPCLADSDWAQLSQSRRVMRWLIAGPPRPSTMHVVRAALMP